MDLNLISVPPAEIEADTLVLFSFDKDTPRDAALTDATGGLVDDLYASGEFEGKPCEAATIHRPTGLKAKRLVLAGAGARAKWNTTELRKAVAAAVRTLKGRSLRNLHVYLDAGWLEAGGVQATVEGVLLGDYEPDYLKTDPKKANKRIESVTVCVPELNDAVQGELARGRIIGEAQNFARDLKNEPSNLLNPQVLVQRAQQMAAEVGLNCEVLDESRMRQLGMGALLGVAMGSDIPPAMIILRYEPENGSGSSDHLALIGKGVTFDSGGISIKPADGMEKMKYDMGGGAAVLGAMRALAQLKPPVRITALVPTVENMINGRAQRPGDIVKSLSGKTVEVLNTDAEGRLILIDAITYALQLGCTHLIDAATLTGAIVVALGHLHVGAFSNDDGMLSRLMSASQQAGERMWHMPLDDDYKDYLKSAFADLPNIGGRYGGAITAAKFLEEFVDKKPWIHLDIAGTAWLDDGKPWMAKGPTGVPVRTFINLAMNWS
ncbi:MAG TPA: leucyl aminopeptidase [Bryobacteraceae bacterium]|nr:leucyl aminopeptidase [Bryobacteraceae bacterium]